MSVNRQIVSIQFLVGILGKVGILSKALGFKWLNKYHKRVPLFIIPTFFVRNVNDRLV